MGTIMRRLVVTITIFVCLISSVQAGFLDGNKLYEFCQNKDDNSCWGYIIGSTDQLLPAQLFLSLAQRRIRLLSKDPLESPYEDICLSEGIKANALADAVKSWLHDNPQRRHKPAYELIIEALSDKFGCTAN